MTLTRDCKKTIQARIQREAGFREALLREGIENFLSGDIETGKIILCDFINATVGFPKLSEITHCSVKSLMRIVGPHGNLQAKNLFEIVKYLQEPRACNLKFGLGAPPHARSVRWVFLKQTSAPPLRLHKAVVDRLLIRDYLRVL
jgi:hypothetical protein